jgi:hypothetical protein
MGMTVPFLSGFLTPAIFLQTFFGKTSRPVSRSRVLRYLLLKIPRGPS